MNTVVKTETPKVAMPVAIPQNKPGLSAYQIAVNNGFEGTEKEWLESLKGEKGDTGEQGPQGEKGDTGATGPQGEKGDTGATGPQGEKGDTGATGPQGEKGDTGEQGPQGEKGDTGVPATINDVNALKITASGGLEGIQEGDTFNMSGQKILDRTGTAEASGKSVTVTDSAEFPLLGLNIYGKSTQDGVPDPTNPVPIVSVGDDGELKVQSCGKNLFDFEAWKDGLAWIKGGSAEYGEESITITAAENDCYTGRPTGSDYRIKVIPGTKYVLSWRKETETDKKGKVLVFYNGDANRFVWKFNLGNNYLNFTAEADVNFITLRVGVDTAGVSVTYEDIQLEEGATATAYEPYTGSTAAITSTLPLCGLPVTEGGNYTDSNGQQWVCDELIFRADGTGKVVKRAAVEVFDGSDDEHWAMSTNNKRIVTDKLAKLAKPAEATNIIAICLCDKLVAKSANDTYTGVEGISFDVTARLGVSLPSLVGNSDLTVWTAFLAENPVTVLYELATPEEIELTAAEMQQLKQLYSYNGVTNVFNDEGAEMTVRYCNSPLISACVKPVMESLQAQIDELKNAILASGAGV